MPQPVRPPSRVHVCARTLKITTLPINPSLRQQHLRAGNRPNETDQLSRHRGHRLVGRLAAVQQLRAANAADVGPSRRWHVNFGLDSLFLACKALDIPGSAPIPPGGLDQNATDVAVAGSRDFPKRRLDPLEFSEGTKPTYDTSILTPRQEAAKSAISATITELTISTPRSVEVDRGA